MKKIVTMIFLLVVIFFGCNKELSDETTDLSLKSAAVPKKVMDTPVITCAGDATQVSLGITVTGGATTGAPAGFTLQWMSAEEFAANNNSWVNSCNGSFSGNANLSRYNLNPGESVTVNIGELLFDNGASTNCVNALQCGTDYVFRAFAHATNILKRSNFTGNITCSTLPCQHNDGCTYTQGYWKTHGPIPTGNNINEWPVNSLVLGIVVYDDLQLQSIFDTPAGGNGLISLAHQLIAAKLNIENGSDGTVIFSTIATADALIGGLIVPPIGSGYLSPSSTSVLLTALANYNEGLTGPGHCD